MPFGSDAKDHLLSSETRRCIWKLQKATKVFIWAQILFLHILRLDWPITEESGLYCLLGFFPKAINCVGCRPSDCALCERFLMRLDGLTSSLFEACWDSANQISALSPQLEFLSVVTLAGLRSDGDKQGRSAFNQEALFDFCSQSSTPSSVLIFLRLL